MIMEFLKQKNISCITDFPLSSYSTLKIGGIGRLGIFPSNEAELCDVINFLNETNEKYALIGRGSNVLFPDERLETILIFTEKLTEAEFDGEIIRASAGSSLTSLARGAAKHNLSGLEFAYGIPGSLGGAVYMNAGAYGSEMSDVIQSVRAYCSREKKIKEFSLNECDFSYRHSVFQNGGDLTVISAALLLTKCESDTEIQSKMKANMSARTEKQPLDLPNAGSAFKRPVGHFAGKLIEDAGLKGLRIGGAAISEKHAGFIVNLGGATSADTKALIEAVKSTVYKKFGVELVPEIKIIE